MSATVTSHASALPDFQGTIVRPSGRFRLRLEKSHGSFIGGTPAAERDLWMISFIIWCLAVFPSAVWHERPCKPERSTVLPHGQGCSSQSGKPSRSPTAIIMTSLSSRRPQELIGYAFNQSLLPGSETASSLALSTWVVTPSCRICWLFWINALSQDDCFIALGPVGAVHLKSASQISRVGAMNGSDAGWHRARMSLWRSSVAAADAKKA